MRTDRRAFITRSSALAVAAAAAGTTPAAIAKLTMSPVNWDAALAAYLAAKSAEDAYSRDVYMPAFHRWRAAADRHAMQHVSAEDKIPGNIEVEIERLQSLRHSAEEALMEIPSPDAAGFARKFLIARGDGRAADGWDDLLEAEARRFIGEGI